MGDDGNSKPTGARQAGVVGSGVLSACDWRVLALSMGIWAVRMGLMHHSHKTIYGKAPMSGCDFQPLVC